jgi:hypothetical protein
MRRDRSHAVAHCKALFQDIVQYMTYANDVKPRNCARDENFYGKAMSV